MQVKNVSLYSRPQLRIFKLLSSSNSAVKFTQKQKFVSHSLHISSAIVKMMSYNTTRCHGASNNNKLSKYLTTTRTHRRRTRMVQSYSRGCANVHTYVTHGPTSLGSPACTTKTASRSVQSFLHSSWQSVVGHARGHGLPLETAPSHGAIWTII